MYRSRTGRRRPQVRGLVLALDRGRLRSFDCGELRRPHGIACDGKGRVYVLSEAESQLMIATVPHSRRFDRVLPTAGEGSHLVTVNREGSLAFCSNMSSNTVTVVFPRPPERILEKWQIAVSRDIGHLITMPHVTKAHVDELVGDIVSAKP